jgi:DNA recombination protein RmuC
MIVSLSLFWLLIGCAIIVGLLHCLHKYTLQSQIEQWLLSVQEGRHAQQQTINDQFSQLRESVRQETALLTEQLHQLDQHTQEQWMTTRTEMTTTLLERLHTHAQSSQTVLIQGLESASRQMNERMEQLSGVVNQRLSHLSEHVETRLHSGFEQTHETFSRVMSRLAVIDEAQKKIEGLTTNVMSLNQLLGDKRARGAFGEVQLEQLISNGLPPNAYAFQTAIPNHPHTRPDCILILPDPNGIVAIDAKFPLENYQKQYHPETTIADQVSFAKAFQSDIKRHIDTIASKYIVPPSTMDSAMMFIPAEAVFAEIHANYPDLIAYSQAKRVWLVSPTTLMAVLNTARSVIKDRETHKHIHSIQKALTALSVEFSRFDERMQRLAKHIKQVSEDVGDMHITSHKISRHFRHIEQADLGRLPKAADVESEIGLAAV